MTTMKCAKIIDGKIEIVEVPIPIPKEGEVLIKVKAFALNRADLLQIEGRYLPPDGSDIPGLEVSGITVESGEEVCALLPSGAYAEYACAAPFPKPKSLSFIEAAALPESLVTCYMNLFKNARAVSEDKVLIHGGSSGIGSFAIQMCKLKGLQVITSISDPPKKQRCLSLGAESVIDYKDAFDVPLKGGIDIILDILGGKHMTKNLNCLKLGGRLCLIAVMSGSKSEINLATVLMKNLKIMGSTLRSKSVSEKQELIKSALLEFGVYINSGALKPVIDSVYSLSSLSDALERIRSREHFGKVVVEI